VVGKVPGTIPNGGVQIIRDRRARMKRGTTLPQRDEHMLYDVGRDVVRPDVAIGEGGQTCVIGIPNGAERVMIARAKPRGESIFRKFVHHGEIPVPRI